MTPPGPDPILIAGPTGVGKSSFAVALALQVGGEIVCADAFQIYRGLAILTAQPTPAQRAAVPHHLYGSRTPGEPCDVHRWVGWADAIVRDIQARQRCPILVGGTGLYFKAFTHGLDAIPPTEPALRAELAGLSLTAQIEKLRALDPAALDQIDQRNPRRVQRALEIILTTGRPLAAFRQSWQRSPRLVYQGLLLQRDRPELHERIEKNVTALLHDGAIEEVQRLLPLGSDEASSTTPSANSTGSGFRQAIGFRHIEALLRGEIDRETCWQSILQDTRAYARRQKTWFRREKDWLTLRPSAEGEFSVEIPGHRRKEPR